MCSLEDEVTEFMAKKCRNEATSGERQWGFNEADHKQKHRMLISEKTAKKKKKNQSKNSHSMKIQESSSKLTPRLPHHAQSRLTAAIPTDLMQHSRTCVTFQMDFGTEG